MPTTVTIEDVREWSARHGGYPIPYRGGMLFKDGAWRDVEGNVRFEPPAEPLARLRLRRVYALALSEEVERDAARLRAVLLGGAGVGERFTWPEKKYGPAPAGGGVEALNSLSFFCELRREAVVRLAEEIEALPEVVARRKREADARESEARESARAAELTAKVRAIR